MLFDILLALIGGLFYCWWIDREPDYYEDYGLLERLERESKKLN